MAEATLIVEKTTASTCKAFICEVVKSGARSVDFEEPKLLLKSTSYIAFAT